MKSTWFPLATFEDKLAGVLMAEASYLKAEMVVEYNEAQLTQEQIKAKVQRSGYQVTAITAAGK